eukprot:CAMPEP_0181280652 /NCGR_PEP_ID=MMETSP1097-20121128/13079_1 /TAXON_ID=35684 /ORGANISM="Pseudopedinella elastica, Strain CCMP716" /LENGTH=104 /DNA_ID=CAMNT_0023383223 /DNA_START=207 /DNA_END=518 /DNA_ORIENTATION=-
MRAQNSSFCHLSVTTRWSTFSTSPSSGSEAQPGRNSSSGSEAQPGRNPALGLLAPGEDRSASRRPKAEGDLGDLGPGGGGWVEKEPDDLSDRCEDKEEAEPDRG